MRNTIGGFSGDDDDDDACMQRKETTTITTGEREDKRTTTTKRWIGERERESGWMMCERERKKSNQLLVAARARALSRRTTIDRAVKSRSSHQAHRQNVAGHWVSERANERQRHTIRQKER